MFILKIVTKKKKKRKARWFSPRLWAPFGKRKNVLQGSMHWMHDSNYYLEVRRPKWWGSSRWVRSLRMDKVFIKWMPFLCPVRNNIFSILQTRKLKLRIDLSQITQLVTSRTETRWMETTTTGKHSAVCQAVDQHCIQTTVFNPTMGLYVYPHFTDKETWRLKEVK